MNPYFCTICDRHFNNKFSLPCAHEFCFSCIHNYCHSKGYNCPICYIELSKSIFQITVNSINNTLYDEKVYWLYSGMYNSGWWCYDSRSNQCIETIYNDFLNINNVKKKLTSYKLKIGCTQYILNFSRMKQINKYNKQKQRTIKRVCMPTTVIDPHKHLRNKYKVKGVSGIKYS